MADLTRRATLIIELQDQLSAGTKKATDALGGLDAATRRHSETTSRTQKSAAQLNAELVRLAQTENKLAAEANPAKQAELAAQIDNLKNKTAGATQAQMDQARAVAAAGSAQEAALKQTAEAHKNAESAALRHQQQIQKLGNVAKGAAVAGFMALAGAVTVAINKAGEFESTFGQIRGLTTTAAGDIDKLKQSVLGLSRDLPVSANDLAKGLYFISSSGYQGAEAMKILEMAGKASAAGLGETATIADAVTSALNAYGLAGTDAARITDILTQTVIEGKGEPADLAGSLGKVLPVAAAAGVEMEQVAAAMAVMTRTGMNADEAATALRGTIGALLAPGKEAKDAFAAIGLTTEQVAAMLRSDQGLVGVLELLMQKTGGNVEELDKFIPNVRALTGVLSSAGSQGAEYARVLGVMNNASGATDKAFSAMSDTFEFKLKKAQNAVENLGISIGNKLLPGLSQAADAASTLIGWNDKLDEALKGVNSELTKSAGSYEEYKTGLLGAAVAAGKISQAQADAYLSGKKLDMGMGATKDVTKEVIAASGLLTEQMWNGVRINEEWANAEDYATRMMKNSTTAKAEAAQAQEEVNAALAVSKEEAKAAGEYYGGLTSKAISYNDSAKKMAELQVELAAATGTAKDKILEQIEALTLADNQARAMEGFKILEEQLKAGAITVDQYRQRTDVLNNTTHLYTDESLAAAQAQQAYLNVLADPNASYQTIVNATQNYAKALRTDAIPSQEEARESAQKTLDKVTEIGDKYRDLGNIEAVELPEVKVKATLTEDIKGMAGDSMAERRAQLEKGAQASTETVQGATTKSMDAIKEHAGKSIAEVNRVAEDSGKKTAELSGSVKKTYMDLSNNIKNALIDMSTIAAGQLNDVKTMVDNLPTYKEMVYKIIVEGTPPSGVGVPEFARGGSIIVPPGYPNDTYPILVSSGEKIIVQTPAQRQAQPASAQNGGANTYNYTTIVNNPLAAAMLLDQQRRERIARSNARMGVA